MSVCEKELVAWSVHSVSNQSSKTEAPTTNFNSEYMYPFIFITRTAKYRSHSQWNGNNARNKQINDRNYSEIWIRFHLWNELPVDVNHIPKYRRKRSGHSWLDTFLKARRAMWSGSDSVGCRQKSEKTRRITDTPLSGDLKSDRYV